MHIIRFQDDKGAVHHGIDRGDNTAKILDADIYTARKSTGKTAKISKLLAPLVPTAIFCIGANYKLHIEECNAEVPERPVIFMKSQAALNNPGDPIKLPRVCEDREQVDYECELAIVIGKPALNVSVEKALDYVLGYTAANDVSARWWQKDGSGGQWIRGKGFNGFCPLGPAIVTTDEIPNPNALRITTTLNGDTVQDGNTDDMLFNVPFLVSYLSQDTTLLPGTVILTGTPSGVGVARTPQRFLRAGDTVTVELEKVGKLTNTVVKA